MTVAIIRIDIGLACRIAANRSSTFSRNSAALRYMAAERLTHFPEQLAENSAPKLNERHRQRQIHRSIGWICD
jgi:hypothetical protein